MIELAMTIKVMRVNPTVHRAVRWIVILLLREYQYTQNLTTFANQLISNKAFSKLLLKGTLTNNNSSHAFISYL